jgi:hypothetical protein
VKCTLATLLALFIIGSTNNALAGVEAVTINGKRVLLKDDKTWEYLKKTDTESRYARLSVVSVKGGKNYCRIGLRLKNDLADNITSIIFMFSIYVDGNVRYDTITKGFQHLKPTNDMYNEISVSGISCKDIDHIRVHGADHCEIGELNKFSSSKGQCLKLVEVEPSDKVVIFKRYEDKPQQTEGEQSDKTPAE